MGKVLVSGIANLFIIFVLCIVFTTCNTAKNTVSSENEVKKDSGALLSIEGMPILAWWGVQEHTVERYKELKECGIDYNLTFYMNVEQLPQAMDAAKEAGVKMIISCPGLFSEPDKFVSRFIDHSALAGYFVSDEPPRNDFPVLGEFVQKIQAADKKHFCYVNLYPLGVPYSRIKTITYLKYVQLFLKEVPVKVLSFDYYPITANKSGVRSLRTRWYENLEIISDEARKSGKPFWAFTLATAFLSQPIPTLADLRLQVYSNLAYGAQGIQYFTYWTPEPYGKWNFHDGPIDNNTNQKTQTWYTVQQMNREIKSLSGVFSGAQVMQVRHIVTNASGKNGSIPKGTVRFDFSNRPAEASIIKTLTVPKNANAVVSFLKNGNRCYMVIINRNLSGGDNITFTVTGGDGLQLIKKDGTAVSASSEDSSMTVTPGDALIYGWDID